MSLRNMMLADAKQIATNVNEFGEAVTYYTRDGDARDISVVVVREALDMLPEAGDVTSTLFQVYVANDSTVGITRDEIDRGGDYIEFPIGNGKEPTRRSIIRILEEDDAMMVLECR